jgi:hypothetical protein
MSMFNAESREAMWANEKVTKMEMCAKHGHYEDRCPFCSKLELDANEARKLADVATKERENKLKVYVEVIWERDVEPTVRQQATEGYYRCVVAVPTCSDVERLTIQSYLQSKGFKALFNQPNGALSVSWEAT